jgi:hypothetical protein
MIHFSFRLHDDSPKERNISPAKGMRLSEQYLRMLKLYVEKKILEHEHNMLRLHNLPRQLFDCSSQRHRNNVSDAHQELFLGKFHDYFLPLRRRDYYFGTRWTHGQFVHVVLRCRQEI